MPKPLVLCHQKEDVPADALGALLGQEPAPGPLYAVEGTLGVNDTPGEPGQVPDDQRLSLSALDPLDAPVPERPRGVPTAAIQLLDDL